jgi:hypothetical protein
VTDGWPACGETAIQERTNAATNPDWNQGSIHGTGFTGQYLGTTYNFPSGQTAAGWHTYRMIWKPGSVQFHIDDPTNIYAMYTPASLSSFSGAVWPFDSGNARSLILRHRWSTSGGATDSGARWKLLCNGGGIFR